MRHFLSPLLRGRGFYIGAIFHDAAERSPSTPITLGSPLHIAPELGCDLTVADLADLVDEVGARLWAVGGRPSERIAIHTSDNFDVAVLACAASRIGMVPALLSPELDEATVVALMERLDRPWLVTDGAKLAASSSGFEAPRTARAVLLASGPAEHGAVALSDLAGSPRREPVFLHPRQPSLITHSSGTTGVPKLAVHCPEAGAHRLIPQKILARALGSHETAAMCVTFVHSRFYQGLAMFLEQDNPMVISRDASPAEIASLLAETRPGYVETHPNTYIDWETLGDDERHPLSSVRYFGATFDAMHPRTMRAMLDASHRKRPRFVLAYGQSEIGPVAIRSYGLRNLPKDNVRCVGWPLPGFIDLRVVDGRGRRLPRGRAGHLEVRSDTRILTYLGEENRYHSQLHNGWWRLGDMGFLDRSGQLHLLDREVDRVDTIESNLAIEDLLLSRLDELREIVIVQGSSGEPVPVVCLRDDVPLDDGRWRQAVADLPAMGQAVQIPFGELPRTSTRKVQRSRLAQMIHARRNVGAQPAPEPQTGAQGGRSAMTVTTNAHRLTELLTGFWSTQAIYTAVVLGLANEMSRGEPRDVEALAATTGTHVESLQRLLDYLGSIDVVDGEPTAGYRLTDFGVVLRDDAAGSMSAHVRVYGAYFYQCWASLSDVIRSGLPAFDDVFGADLFTYLSKHPEISRDYEQMMIEGAPYFADIGPLADLTGDEIVVDVGGGNGALLRALLGRHPSLSGILFDTPHVIEETRGLPIATTFGDRCQRVSGDLLTEVPSGGDVYILSRVLHCFADEPCRTILGLCRQAMSPNGRLIVLERVMKDAAESPLTPGFNLHMLTILGGGRERDLPALDKLLHSSGFERQRHHSLSMEMSMIVATPCVSLSS